MVPVGAVTYIIFVSSLMGYFAKKKKIKNYFKMYVKQVYDSSFVLQRIYRVSQRGKVLPQ